MSDEYLDEPCDHCGGPMTAAQATVHYCMSGTYHQTCIAAQLRLQVDTRYPFREELEKREHTLQGLEKLQAYRDRELAVKLFLLWMQSQPRQGGIPSPRTSATPPVAARAATAAETKEAEQQQAVEDLEKRGLW